MAEEYEGCSESSNLLGPAPEVAKKVSRGLRMWNSLSCLEYASVHAIAAEKDVIVPFGCSVHGLNLFGIAFWGVLVCYLFEEIYCELVLVSPPSPVSFLTLPAIVYLTCWLCGLLLIIVCSHVRQQGNTLSVVFFLWLSAIPAGGAGWVFELADYSTPPNSFDLHMLPNRQQPYTLLLLIVPFIWPVFLLLLLASCESIRRVKRRCHRHSSLLRAFAAPL